MTKIEVYKKEVRNLNDMITVLNALTSSSCDKKAFTVKDCDSYYGRYGSSSVRFFGEVVETAIKEQVSLEYIDILRRAIVRQEKLVLEKKSDAREEAEEILRDTEQEATSEEDTRD